jgi:hypothetical protein
MRLFRPIQDAFDRLLRELGCLTKALQEHSESIRKQTSTNEEHDKTPPVLRAELEIPQSIRDEYHSKTSKRNRHENWKLGVEIVTALAVIAYTTVAAFQWCTSNRTLKEIVDQTNIANKQLQAQRAYFIVSSYDTAPLKDHAGNLVGFRFTVQYQNVGNTPANNAEMRYGLVVLRKQDISPGGVPDLPIRDWEHRLGPRVPVSIAPHQITRSSIDLSISDAEKITSGDIFVYLWTEARYQDVFTRDKIHRYATCVQLIQISSLGTNAPFTFQSNSLKHNFAD